MKLSTRACLFLITAGITSGSIVPPDTRAGVSAPSDGLSANTIAVEDHKAALRAFADNIIARLRGDGIGEGVDDDLGKCSHSAVLALVKDELSKALGPLNEALEVHSPPAVPSPSSGPLATKTGSQKPKADDSYTQHASKMKNGIVKGLWWQSALNFWKQLWPVVFRVDESPTFWAPMMGPFEGPVEGGVSTWTKQNKELAAERFLTAEKCGGKLGGNEDDALVLCGLKGSRKQGRGAATYSEKVLRTTSTICEHGIINDPMHPTLGPPNINGTKKNLENFPARFEKRKSWVDPRTVREFFVMNFTGKATRNPEYPANWEDPQECKMQYYVYLATCSDCCCEKGYIQSETNAFNLSPQGHNCDVWFLKASSFASMFFGIDRKGAMVDMQAKCLCGSPACSAAQKKCHSSAQGD